MPDPTPLEIVAERARHRDEMKRRIDKLRLLQTELPPVADELANSLLEVLTSDFSYDLLQRLIEKIEGEDYHFDDDLVENDDIEEHYGEMLWNRALILLSKKVLDLQTGGGLLTP